MSGFKNKLSYFMRGIPDVSNLLLWIEDTIPNRFTAANTDVSRNVSTLYQLDTEDQQFQFSWANWSRVQQLTSQRTVTTSLITVYFFIFQFIYRWQILFQLAIRLAFHKQQGLYQTSGAISNIVEGWYCWYQTFETESQFVVLIKVNINQNRNAKMHPTDKWHYIKVIW